MINLKNIHLNARHCRVRDDEPGLQWGPREIPDYEIVFVIEGEYLYVDEIEGINVLPGDLLLIEPQKRHTFMKVADGNPGIHACIHFDLLDKNDNTLMLNSIDCMPLRKTYIEEYEYFKGVFYKLSKVFLSQSKLHSEIANTIARQIWLMVAEKWPGTRDKDVPERISEMTTFLRENITRPISRIDLAEKFHYTPEYVNYLFKKELKTTPSKFLNRERVIAAFKYIYEDGVSVQQAARLTGFSNQYYFSKVFKSIFGYPPAKIKMYRKQNIDNIYEKKILKQD